MNYLNVCDFISNVNERMVPLPLIHDITCHEMIYLILVFEMWASKFSWITTLLAMEVMQYQVGTVTQESLPAKAS